MSMKVASGPSKGKTFQAIYEVEGESLKICRGPGRRPPRAFRSVPDNPLILLENYKRAK